jgi:hypothetical protein
MQRDLDCVVTARVRDVHRNTGVGYTAEVFVIVRARGVWAVVRAWGVLAIVRVLGGGVL